MHTMKEECVLGCCSVVKGCNVFTPMTQRLRRFDIFVVLFFFSSRRRHTRLQGDWSSDVCSSDLESGTTALRWCSAPSDGVAAGLSLSLQLLSCGPPVRASENRAKSAMLATTT